MLNAVVLSLDSLAILTLLFNCGIAAYIPYVWDTNFTEVHGYMSYIRGSGCMCKAVRVRVASYSMCSSCNSWSSFSMHLAAVVSVIIVETVVSAAAIE